VTKKLIKHGNSAALVIDKALLDALNVDMDTPLEISTDGQNIIVSPQGSQSDSQDVLDALERINRNHGSTLNKLGE
jgi:antitoxin component of MazEF toxin-antitoxin module